MPSPILADSMSLLQKVKSGMGRPDLNVSRVDSHLRKLNSCGYTALDMPEWREMTEQTDWRTKQPSQVACVSEDLKCWGAWDTICGHKTKYFTPSIAWRREAWKEEALDDLPWKNEVCIHTQGLSNPHTRRLSNPHTRRLSNPHSSRLCNPYTRRLSNPHSSRLCNPYTRRLSNPHTRRTK